MGTWKRRKKYSIEEDKTKEKKFQFKLGNLVRRELYLTMASIMGVTLIIMGSTYSVFSSVNKAKDYNVINIGTLQVTFDETASGLKNVLNLTNAYPVSAETGSQGKGYTFTIKNTGTLGASYSVKIAKDQAMIDADGCANNLIPDNQLMYLIDDTPYVYSKYLSDVASSDYVVKTGQLGPGDSKTITIRLWISENAGNSVLGQHFHGKVVVESLASSITAAKDSILAEERVLEPVANMFSYTSEGKGIDGIVNNTYVTNGLYTAEDDDGISYYFRGNVNNYVLFAGQLWRIIRINGDGTVRIILEGNSSSNLTMYDNDSYFLDRIGYSYYRNTSMESNSYVKDFVESWYDSTIKNTTYEQYVATGKFCSDSSDSGYMENAFGAYGRLIENKDPSLKCPATSRTFGGSYNLKVGLITADEVAMAGALFGVVQVPNNSMYLSSSSQWTMSPDHFNNSTNEARVFLMNPDGTLTSSLLDQYYNANPVINLKASVTLSGSGTQADPFVVQ